MRFSAILLFLLFLTSHCSALASSYGFPQKAEDAAHSSGDKGFQLLGVNNASSETTYNSTTSDYTPVAVNGSGFVQTMVQNSTKPTYIGATGFFTPAASATDVFEMLGSGTKTVKVQKILVNYKCTTSATPNDFYLKKLTAAGSGGTSSATTFTALDSGNAAATATAKHYTANPTAATSTTIHIVSSAGTSTGSAALASSPPIVLFDAALTGQPLVLRGTAQGFVVNNNGASFPNTANSISVTVIFTEE